MGQNFAIVIVTGFIVAASPAILNAQSETESNPAEVCGAINSPKDLLRCALQKHPLVLRAEALRHRSAKAESRASAFPNPEASTTTTYGKSLGDKLWTFEASLDQKLEIGGKRSARIQAARAEVEQVEGDYRKAQEEAFLDTIHNLNRHRQIHEELAIVDEAISAFQRVANLYRNRGRLSAEQEVSAEVFTLALGEHKMRRSKLLGEKAEVKKHLELIIGQSLSEDERLMPPFRKVWPTVSELGPEQMKNGALLSAAAEVRATEAEWKAARAESWPDLTVGPVFSWDREGPSDVYRYGLNLSLPLPFWNWNRAGRAYAERAHVAAQQNYQLTITETKSERSQRLEEYRSIIEAITMLTDLKDLEKKHARIERLFEQGLVSTSLFIEAHRQIQEFASTRNEQEHEANEALWKIYAMDGKMFEEALWETAF